MPPSGMVTLRTVALVSVKGPISTFAAGTELVRTRMWERGEGSRALVRRERLWMTME